MRNSRVWSPGSAQAALMDGMCQRDDYRHGLTQARTGAAGCVRQMPITSQQGIINRSKYGDRKKKNKKKTQIPLRILMDGSVLFEF